MVDSEADEKLLIETAQRDPRQFVDLYRAYFDRVYAYVTRRVATRSDAQDVTAEVFERALAALRRFEWRGVPFAAWLYRIAANAVADHHHRTVRDQDVPMIPEPARDECEAAERRASLYRAVRELPPDQRRVIEMRFARRQEHRRDRGRAREKRGSGEAITVARARRPAGATGSTR